MTQALVEVLKAFLRPSSITLLLGLITVGVVLAFVRRTERFARWYFAALLTGFWILSAPACAERLVLWQGGRYQPLERAADARGASTVVVLSAGGVTVQARGYTLDQVPWVTALRVVEGARLFALLDHPTIIVSGGITDTSPGARPEADAMRTALIELGVPADRVVAETESKNTREEAMAIARMLAGQPARPVVLVTSPTHMGRSLAVFRAAGIDAIPSAAPYKSDHAFERLRWLPTDGGLRLSDSVVYDVAAAVYYRAKGWTK